jgi:outer membrane protein OmpA-like peptidoglycan-associated protein
LVLALVAIALLFLLFRGCGSGSTELAATGGSTTEATARPDATTKAETRVTAEAPKPTTEAPKPTTEAAPATKTETPEPTTEAAAATKTETPEPTTEAVPATKADPVTPAVTEPATTPATRKAAGEDEPPPPPSKPPEPADPPPPPSSPSRSGVPFAVGVVPLPDGGEHRLQPGSIEAQLATLLHGGRSGTHTFRFDRIAFEAGSHHIHDGGAEQVWLVGELLRYFPESSVVVRGHRRGDESPTYTGTDDPMGDTLSEIRAYCVSRRFLKQGVSAERVRVVGVGVGAEGAVEIDVTIP